MLTAPFQCAYQSRVLENKYLINKSNYWDGKSITWASLIVSMRMSSMDFFDIHSDPERKEVAVGGTIILSWYLFNPIIFSAVSYCYKCKCKHRNLSNQLFLNRTVKYRVNFIREGGCNSLVSPCKTSGDTACREYQIQPLSLMGRFHLDVSSLV